MYSLTSFRDMMCDSVRMDSYVEALKRTVKSGSVVLDIGTGTGVFALVACQLGASRVYAVDANPLIELGRQMSVANGYADRITFIQGLTTKIDLPEKVDVVVGDIRGQLPILGGAIHTFKDAKERFLKPGGTIIPKQDKMYTTLLDAPELYTERVLTPWQYNPYDLDMRAAIPMVINTDVKHKNKVEAKHVLLPPQHWATINYGETNFEHINSTLEWVVERPGTAHFVYVWFDAYLTDAVVYSNAPGAKRAEVYGSLAFPLTTPVALEVGDKVTLELSAHHSSKSYIYTWNTKVFKPENPQKPAVNFHQSSLFAQPLAGLIKRTETYKPRLTIDGKIQAYLLDAMSEGTRSISELAVAALEKFPETLRDYDNAFAYVADVSQTYSL